MSGDATKLEKAKAATKPSALSRACNEQEMRFAQAFVANGGDRLAALRAAGYNPKDAASGGALARKLTGRPHVAQAIAALSGNAALVAKHVEALRPEDAAPVASPDELERFWTDVMRGIVTGEAPLLRVRIRASELLAQRHGMLEGKDITPVVVNNSGDGGVSVKVEVVRNGRVPVIDATPKDDR